MTPTENKLEVPETTLAKKITRPERRRRVLIAKLSQMWGMKCHYCSLDLSQASGNHPTIDHRIPKKNGGKLDESNAVIACEWCNRSKGSESLADFERWLGHVRRSAAQ